MIGNYAPPQGLLLLGRVDHNAAGITAVKRLSPGTAELIRVWVRPAFRGLGLTSALLDHALAAARAMHVRSIRLETSPAIMPRAYSMYRARGFNAIVPYSGLEQHAADIVAMELELDG
jgi:ribosomal protein S18 acetylase RimI-like enzyme